MNRDRVLVSMDRIDAEDAQAEMEHLDAHRLSHRLTAREARHRDALRAALDADREEPA